GTGLKGSPSPGLDCSGLPFACAAALGIDIPRTSEEQFAGLTPITPAEAMQGDLVFYDVKSDTQAQPAHEGVVWVPDVNIIAAPHTGSVVKASSLFIYPIMGYRRITFADDPASEPSAPSPVPKKTEENMITSVELADGTIVT